MTVCACEEGVGGSPCACRGADVPRHRAAVETERAVTSVILNCNHINNVAIKYIHDSYTVSYKSWSTSLITQRRRYKTNGIYIVCQYRLLNPDTSRIASSIRVNGKWKQQIVIIITQTDPIRLRLRLWAAYRSQEPWTSSPAGSSENSSTWTPFCNTQKNRLNLGLKSDQGFISDVFLQEINRWAYISVCTPSSDAETATFQFIKDLSDP